jgi:hypothetical protein
MDSFLVPDWGNTRASDITPIVEFIAKKLLSLNRSLRTAKDERERSETIGNMTLCASSLSILTLAYLSETDRLNETAKEIMREVAL